MKFNKGKLHVSYDGGATWVDSYDVENFEITNEGVVTIPVPETNVTPTTVELRFDYAIPLPSVKPKRKAQWKQPRFGQRTIR